MNIIKLFYLGITFCWILNCFSQPPASVDGGFVSTFKPPQKQTPSVPSVAAFEKYGNVPVNTSSGLPQINIPITVIKLKDFEWPVSLSYHASGIRPSDISSNVGSGWVLNASGVITIAGGSGIEEIPRQLNLNHIPFNEYGKCIPENEVDVNIANDIVAAGGSNGAGVFSFQTPLFSGKFNFNGATFPASNMKIQFINEGGIIITDETGNRYEFLETTANRPISNCMSPQQNYVSRKTTLSRYLKRIITYNSDTITFKYETEEYSYNKAPLYIYKRPEMIQNPVNPCGSLNPEDVVCENSYVANDKRLVEIESSTGEVVRFFFRQRLDLVGASRLEKIQVLKSNSGRDEVLQNLKLVQSYFGTGSPENLRLKLDAFEYLNKNDLFVKGYRFFYEDGQTPNRLISDFILNVNYWGSMPSVNGYYNISKAGALKRIQYPTGGETLFSYEVLPGMGRLRITGIRDYKAESGVVNERTFSYQDDQDLSIAPLMFSKVEQFFNPVCNIDNSSASYLQICFRSYWQSEPISDDNGYQYINNDFFKKVTEYFGKDGTNGRIEYDYALIQRDQFFSSEIIPSDPVLVKKKIFELSQNAGYSLVQEEENLYEIPPADNPINFLYTNQKESGVWVKRIELFRPFLECTPRPTEHGGIGSFMWWCPQFNQFDYKLVSAPVQLMQTIVKIFAKSSPISVSTDTTKYYYEDPFNISPSAIETWDSKGKRSLTKMWYPTFLNSISNVSLSTRELSSLSFLKEANNISTPFLVETYSDNKLLTRKVISYDIVSGSKAKVVHERVFPTGGNLFKETKVLAYDGNYNPTEVLDERGNLTSIQYNIKRNIPISISINGSNRETAYSGFEVDEMQNFTILPVQRLNNGLLGKSSYSLSFGNIVKDNLPNKEYSISCWGRSGTIFVNGTLMNVVATASGWNLYNLSVTGSSITISGTAQIDELRVHPKLAEMKTYNYGLFGISNISDGRNLFISYEYDDFGKLSRVKDYKGNITNEYEYKYVEHKANWVPTGNSRCAPCYSNPDYLSSIVEVEERDLNAQSNTFNVIRWVPNGERNNGCSVASWVFTNDYRCGKYDGDFNTGWRQRMRRDVNPCSPTFNQTEWVNISPDLNACPPQFLFARFTVTPVQPIFGSTTQLLSVEFFRDYECTIPAIVTNMEVSVRLSENFSNRLGVIESREIIRTYIVNGSGQGLDYLETFIEQEPFNYYMIEFLGNHVGNYHLGRN